MVCLGNEEIILSFLRLHPSTAFHSFVNFYAEYIILNAGLDEAQAGIKIGGRNINNLRYANDTTLMAENEEELKSLKRRSWHPVPSLHGK